MKEVLSSENIKYAYLDITESFLYLKMFLKLRDNRSEFDDIRKIGRVGLPCISINDGERIVFEITDSIINNFKNGNS